MKVLKMSILALCISVSPGTYSQISKNHQVGKNQKEMIDPKINTFSKPPQKNAKKLFDQITLPNGKQKVTVDNFVRAETDNYFKIRTNDGCFGKLCHNSGPADVNHQSIIRTNRDTRYSYGIFDLNTPLTIVMPDTKGRFQSMMVINEDSYIRVFYKPGSYTFTKENTGTRFIHITIRTLADPNSEEDNKIVSEIQDVISYYENIESVFRKEIKVLTDLKKQIVFSVVTGKLDVSGIKIPNYEYTEDDGEDEDEEQED